MSAPVAEIRVKTPWLLEDEAAAYLRVCAKTMANWRSTGTGPRYSKLSPKKVVYKEIELDRWADARSRTSTAEDDAELKTA